MCGIKDQKVRTGFHQSTRSLLHVRTNPDGRTDAQAPTAILGCQRELDLFLDVLDSDEALENPVVIDNQQLLDFVTAKDFLGLIESNADRRRHQTLVGHQLGDWPRGIRLKAGIPVSEDAH